MSFYIPALNKEYALGAVGVYAGNVITPGFLPATELAGAINLSSVIAAFKFYTTLGNVNNVTDGDANWTPMNKGIIDAVNIIHGNVGTGDEANGPIVIREVLQTLATAVFGSPEAVDLFSNGDAIAESAGFAINACRLAVAENESDMPVLQIGNAMINAEASRFALLYGAAYAEGSPSTLDAGTYTVTATSASTTSTAASVSIVIGAGSSIGSMSVTSVGSGYVAGESVTFVINDGTNPPATIIISAPNPVQLAMLMGTLDDDENGVSFPFETGDIIKVKYSIAPIASQPNSAGSVVNPAIGTHHFYTNFEVVADVTTWNDPNLVV